MEASKLIIDDFIETVSTLLMSGHNEELIQDEVDNLVYEGLSEREAKLIYHTVVNTLNFALQNNN